MTRRIIRLAFELIEEDVGPPSYDAETTAEALDDEVSRVLTVGRATLRKCSAVVVPFQRRQVAR
jgi:hypothetical protein